ncbi:hypothetical protein [Rhizobium sp. LC145]|jgi:hypothetical protein|nr:hypothetical protein [Rhizobium sp. LC145]
MTFAISGMEICRAAGMLAMKKKAGAWKPSLLEGSAERYRKQDD